MIRPRIQDGELARGAIGRYKVFNELPSYAVAVGCIRLHAAVENKSLTVSEALALGCGVSLRDLIARNTMLPYTAHVSSGDVATPNCAWPSGTLRRLGLALPRSHAYLCRSCVANDLADGYSYWRRDHQLPGAYVCQRHKEPLLRMPDLSALDDQPSESLEDAEVDPLANSTEVLESEAVVRFQRFSMAFLGRAQPIDAKQYSETVIRRGTAHGFVTRPRVKCQRISEFATRLFPPQWLYDVFPGIVNSTPGELFPPIDYALKPTGHAVTAGHCVALAIMYDSPADFFDDLEGRLPAPREERTFRC